MLNVAWCGGSRAKPQAAGSIVVDKAGVGAQSVCAVHRTPHLQNYTAGPGDIVARFSGGDGDVHSVACADSIGTSRKPTFHRTTSGSVTFVGLQEGRHILRVYAVDEAGNKGPEKVYGWDIDLTSPTVSFQAGGSSKPPALTNSGNAKFRVQTDESLVTMECRLACASRVDGLLYTDMNQAQISALVFAPCPVFGAFRPCGTTITFAGLTSAIHKFQARATDEVGNVQSVLGVNGFEAGSTTAYVWEIDLEPPVPAFTEPPEFVTAAGVVITRKPSVSFKFAANEPRVAYECQRCILAPSGDGALDVSLGCSDYRACPGDGTLHWWNAWRAGGAANSSASAAGGAGGSLGVLTPQPSEVTMCSAAIDRGCTPADVHANALRSRCREGFLGVCGFTQYSYLHDQALASLAGKGPGSAAAAKGKELTTCPALEVTATAAARAKALACIKTGMLTHLLRIRSKDLAGNVGADMVLEFMYDNIRPAIAEIRTSVSQHANAALLLDQYIPKRPFAATRAGGDGGEGGAELELGTTQELNEYTEDAEIVLAFNTSNTEDYRKNGPTHYKCGVFVGTRAAVAMADCTSPYELTSASLANSSLARQGLTREDASGRTVLRDGTYSFRVAATDFSGNAGNVKAFKWTVDTSKPSAVFTNDRASPWHSTPAVRFGVLCTEPGCTFQCRVEFLEAPAPGLAGVGPLPRKVLEPYQTCGLADIKLRVLVQREPKTTTAGGGLVGLEQQLAFAQSDGAGLVADLEAKFPTYTVHDTAVGPSAEAEGGSGGGPVVEVKFRLRLRPGLAENATLLQAAFEAFKGGFAAGGRLKVGQFLYDGLVPIAKDLSALHPEAFGAASAGLEYRKYSFSVIATDAVGVRGNPVHHVFYIDTEAPVTGLTRTPALSPLYSVSTTGDADFGFASAGLLDTVASVLGTAEEASSFDCRLQSLCWPQQEGGVACAAANHSVARNLSAPHAHGWQSCTPAAPPRYRGLPDGAYRFEVAARDRAGNRDATPAVLAFVVDATPPVMAVLGLQTAPGSIAASFAASRFGCTYTCAVLPRGDGTGSAGSAGSAVAAAAETCTSPYVKRGLAAGNYSLVVTAVDRAMRNDSARAEFTVASLASTEASEASGPGYQAPTAPPCETHDTLLLATIVAWALVVVLGGLLFWVYRKADRVANPHKTSKTRRCGCNWCRLRPWFFVGSRQAAALDCACCACPFADPPRPRWAHTKNPP